MKKKNRYKISTPNGVDEKTYVNINGQEQYVFIRGNDVNNPMILNLHGGPANPDAFFTYEFAKEIVDDFTYVSWDQRGCGRTYYKNKSTDPENKTADFEQAIEDVDALVNYLCDRFKKDKVILMGHSYGSLLGVNYVSKHPEKVESYIGIGQSVSIAETQARNYNEIMSLTEQDNPKLSKLTEAYLSLKENFNLENLSGFQRLTMSFFLANMPDLKQKNQLKLIFSSPDLAFSDIRWLLGMLNLKGHYTGNKKLLDYTFSANVYDAGTEFLIPMYFISGEYDKHCNVDVLGEYYEAISAPVKELVIIKKCGHSPQIAEPVLFAEEVKRLLRKKL